MNTHSAVSWLVLLSLVLIANAQNATAAIPSVPELKVGWQAGPTERGTLTLVYSCLITVFACTWTVLHLNVPGLYDGPWTKALRKAKWMAITVLFPEFILSKAICDLRLALNDLREFDMVLKEEYNDDFKWTVSSSSRNTKHTWSWKVSYGPRPSGTYHTTQYWTPTHSYFANMGGLLYPQQYGLVRDNSPRYHALTGAKLSHRFCWGSDHPLQGLVLDKQDIEDKSKADWLLKSLAVLQITWLILTVLVRGVTGLPVTQLEIATLAFSIFAIATYAANWWKPKDVSQPTRLQALSSGSAKPNAFDRTQEFMLRLRAPAKAADMAQRIRDTGRVQNDVVWIEGNMPFIFSIMAVSALVFGGLHCLAWNFEFPSRAELILWRTASLTSAILPVISLASSLALNYVATTYTDRVLISSLMRKLKPLDPFPADSGIVYTASRLIILVLLFTCLRAVPERVYENTPWTRFLPNIS
ncbi:hypothetical protein BKA61DRAFT_557532 [Leptodontidium sp. MPI-SDFR-AT-0119]|nr:hypothetical protein BKA61DRAFT_557532 [Leptodontidium sp. MPI-SDFR-AT-0119]